MTDFDTAEWGYYEVLNELSRRDHDRRTGYSNLPARGWSIRTLRTMYAYAFTHPYTGPPPHTSDPHRCDRDECSELNRQWWAAYQRNRRMKQKVA